MYIESIKFFTYFCSKPSKSFQFRPYFQNLLNLLQQTKKDLDSFDQAELIENLQGMVEVAQQMNQEQNEGKGCSETKEDGE